MPTTAAVMDTSPNQYSEQFTACPETVYLTRSLVRTALSAWGLDEYESDACQIMSELASNAAQLCEGKTIRAWVSRIDSGIELCVWDEHPGQPEVQTPTRFQECGRGLIIVQAFASGGCGWCRLGAGKTVWARIAIDMRQMRDAARRAGAPIVGRLPHVDRPTPVHP